MESTMTQTRVDRGSTDTTSIYSEGADIYSSALRPGGNWRLINSAPHRDDIAFYGEYLEVTPPSGYRWTFMFDMEGVGPTGGPETFILDEVDGKTKVTSIGHMGSPEVLEGALSTGMVGGAIETWDRLEALLAGG
jgi:uncharacterized protein YndB with AHSA1/START domain